MRKINSRLNMNCLIIDGYTPWVAPDSDFVIEDNVLKNVNEITEAGKIH